MAIGASEQTAETTVAARPLPERSSRLPRRLRWIGRASLLTLVVGLGATGALSWAALMSNQHNEHRLLALQTRQAATVLQALVPALQTPLSSAAEIAATSDGDPARFRDYISSYVGPQRSFVSASLWRVSSGDHRVIAHTGARLELPDHPARARAFLAEAARTPAFDVVGPIGAGQPRVGFAFASTGTPTYVVYAESRLPADRRTDADPDSAFTELRFALYLGDTPRPGALLETNSDQVPIRGDTATETVPFGGGVITLVAARSGHLGGALSGALWWLVAIAGLVVTVPAASVAEYLVRRRRSAERLTRETGHRLVEQRGISEALQHALLPQLPEIPGVDIAVRYRPGTAGVDIGGDWYDVIAMDERRFFFAVGDVSGRGVRAGSTMAALLFAMRGFVSEGHGPAAVLQRLARLLDVARDAHFATVVCGVVDRDRGEVSVASAGHLPLLLVPATGADFVAGEVGAPIGVPTDTPYTATTVPVAAGTRVFAFTDGLVERRGETIDDGLHRLRRAATASTAMDLDGQLTVIAAELAGEAGGFDDDTAILGMRWRQ